MTIAKIPCLWWDVSKLSKRIKGQLCIHCDLEERYQHRTDVVRLHPWYILPTASIRYPLLHTGRTTLQTVEIMGTLTTSANGISRGISRRLRWSGPTSPRRHHDSLGRPSWKRAFWRIADRVVAETLIVGFRCVHYLHIMSNILLQNFNRYGHVRAKGQPRNSLLRV